MSFLASNMSAQVPPDINIKMAPFQRNKRKTTLKHPSFWKNAREYFSEYTEATTLNGFRYLGEQNRSTFEKILWLVIICVSLGLCTILILETYRKWDTTPVIVTFAHSPMPVWKVPFPAITICPETKWRQSVYNFTHYYDLYENNRENLSDLELESLGQASLLCQLKIEGNLITDEDVFQFMEKMAPNKTEVIVSCNSRALGPQCETRFSTVMTEEGICYSFNMLHWDDIYKPEVDHVKTFQNHQDNVTGWSIEKGYANSAGKNAYPRRTMSAGDEGGLRVLLMAFDEDFDYLCRRPTLGFKVLLHNPGEMPQMSSQYFRVPFDEDVTVAVKPDVIKTSNSLRNYDPHKRGCYFANERELRYYKNYTQQNCQMECLTNYTLKMCNCVSFYMPRQKTTSICGPGSTPCVNRARDEILTGNAMEEFSESTTDVDCDCLPSCTTLSYNAEMSQTYYDWRKFMTLIVPDVYSTELMGARISAVSIFFKDMQFITSERNELYGMVDFLANCGGLLGLFIGFSFISLLETVYFLTIRLGFNWRKYGRHYWSGSEDLLQNKMNAHEK